MGWPKKILRRSRGGGAGGAGHDDGLGRERNVALVCKHFGLSAIEIETDLPWHRWIRYLAVALDLEELADYRAYVLAGGEPKKFRWATPDHAGTRAPEGQGIPEFLQKAYASGKVKKTDIYEFGKATGKKQVFKGVKWEQRADGTYYPVGEVYVDEQGREIDIGDQIYVPTQHPEALEKARQVFGAESLN